jgi:hypothetical protein
MQTARTVRDLVTLVEDCDSENNDRRRPELYAAVLAIAEKRGQAGRIDNDRLGRWLNANENTIAAGYKLTADRSDKRRPRWRLNPISPA